MGKLEVTVPSVDPNYSDDEEGSDTDDDDYGEIDPQLLTVTTVITMEDDRPDNINTMDPKPVQILLPERKPRLWKRIPALGLFLTVLKIVISGFGNLVIKNLDVDPIVLVFYRSFVLFSIAIPWTISADESPFPPGQPIRTKLLLITRSVCSFLGALSGVFAVQNMSLGDMQMINGVQPIFVSLFARLFLSEALGVPEFLSTILMMSGICLVLKPPFLFSEETDMKDSNFWLAAALHFGATMLTANVVVILRYLRSQSISSLTASREIIFVIFCFIIIMFANMEITLPSTEVKLKILGLAMFTLTTSTLNLIALKLEEANKVALVDRCSGITVALLLDFFFFHKIPDYVQIIGVSLVITAIIIIGAKKIIAGRRKNSKGYLEADTKTIEDGNSATKDVQNTH